MVPLRTCLIPTLLLVWHAGASAAAPVLQFSTHFGGGWNTDARATVDSQGNAWFAVTTERIDLPVSPDAAQGPIVPSDPNCRNEFSIRCLEVWIGKISPTGQILRSTYLGGFSGATAAGIALDASGAVWVAGTTSSTDFPQIKPIAGATAKSGVFVAKLTPDLTRVVSATAIPVALFTSLVMTLDGSGFIYVAGSTISNSLPLKNAFQSDFRGGSDGFLMKLDPTGSTLVYSTLFGGTGFDSITAVAADASGSPVVVGQTGSTDFPVKGAVQSTFAGGFSDGFVARLTADGQLSWSTYTSGTAGDTLQAVVLNSGGDVYTSGYTDLPPSVRAATLTRYSADGHSIVLAKTLAGVNGLASLAFDPQGNLWAFGETLAAPDAPAVAPDAFQDQAAGSTDTVLVEWSAAGDLVWSTFFAGSFPDHARSVAIDPTGAILLAGLTESADFPRAHPDLPSQIGSARPDAFLARFGFSLPAPTLPDGTVTNAASFALITPDAGAAPGAILALFGEDLATRILPARSLPLAGSLAGTSVLVNGEPAPLYYVSTEQVNFQLPYNVSGSATIRIVRGNAMSAEREIAIAVASPAIFSGGLFNAPVVVRFANGQLVGSQNPASAGDILVIYANGLGDVTPAVAAGTSAPDPPAATVNSVSVTLNGQPLAVSFAGLAPGFAGLYQINAKVPDAFQPPPRSPAAPLVVSVSETTSQPVNLDVK